MELDCPICKNKGIVNKLVLLNYKIRIPKKFHNKNKEQKEWKTFTEWLVATFPY